MTADEETRIETFDVPQINENHPATVLYDFYNVRNQIIESRPGPNFIKLLSTTYLLSMKCLHG